MAKQEISLFGQDSGHGVTRVHTFDANRDDYSPDRDWHRSYFCTICGTIWALWKTEGAFQYYAIHRSCPAHRAYASERPGSLLVRVSEDLAMLPKELLLRELELP